MYTVVLMAALSTSPAVPDFGRRHGCHGGRSCCGCCGGYSGCHGYVGCSGGCWGSGVPYDGCTGGGVAYGGCTGGCHGAAYGTAPYVGGYGAIPPVAGTYSATPYAAPYGGGYYDRGVPGQSSGTTPLPAQGVPAYRTTPRSTEPANKPASLPRTGVESVPSDQVRVPAPATIVVTLPANARLTFNGTATRTTSSRRVFTSPPLEPGETYHYQLAAQLVREGQPVTVTQRVDVRAGQTARVALTFPAVDATARR